jgi:predicted MFS family arabinose efflux permease
VTLAILGGAQFLVVANITLVTIALPAVQRDLRMPAAMVPWTITSYTLAFAGTLLLCGRLTDRYGQRRMLLAGLGLFAAGSLGCGLATHPAVLLAARGVQGLGAAVIAASALVVLLAVFPGGPRRARALGVWSAAQAAGGATGWLAGGVVSQVLGWRWVFLGSIAVAALAAVAALRVLPAGTRRMASLDVPGAVLVTTGLLLVLLGLTGQLTAVALPAGLLALVGFHAARRRARDPLLPVGALRDNRPLATGVLVLFLINALSTPVLVLCAGYLQETAGLPTAVSGLLFIPFNLAVLAGSIAGARRATPAVRSVAIGLIGAGAGILVLLPGTAAYLAPLLAGFVLLGLGGGAAGVIATAHGTETGPGSVSSGLLNTATELGVATGSATLLTIAATAGPQVAISTAAGIGLLAAVTLALRAPARANAPT